MEGVRLEQGLVEGISRLIKMRRELGYETVREFVIVACLKSLLELHTREANV